MSLLTAQNLSKSYAGIPVLHSVSLDLLPGEVHALVGENGAGKSTLCRILSGITPPDPGGSMLLRSQPYSPHSRRDAEYSGVRMVMQELNLIPTLTVAENIYIDSMPRRLGIINYRKLNADASRAVESLGLRNIHPNRLISTLGVGQAQLVEIAAALAKRCDVLFLDEPTAALTAPEITLLFAQIRRLQQAGVAILYVSHRMEEIRALADRITILRDGRHITTQPISELSHEQTVRLMVGRDLPQQDRPTPVSNNLSPITLKVENLSLPPSVKNISFHLHKGEILGFAGLMGSGRTETMRALFAADRPHTGRIYLHGSPAPSRLRSPRDAVRNRIAFLTEDRKSQGLLLPLSIQSNTTLTNMPAVSRLSSWIDPKRERATAEQYITSLSTRCRSPQQPVGQLSGGNQQKVVIAKWLFRDCDILIFDEPTRGIDVGAKFEIYRLLRELADAGKSIIVVSSDLPELTAISDRIAVMSAGHLVQTFPRGQWTEESLLTAALSQYKSGP